MCRNPITSKHGEKQMEEETCNELLITTEPQETEQPTNPQPTTQPNPEPKQEATKTPKQEEKKMSEADLSKMSLEELQAEIERRKQEAAKPKFVLDENDPSNLAKFVKLYKDSIPEYHPILKPLVQFSEILPILYYPGKLTTFCKMYDKENKIVNNKEMAETIEIKSEFDDVDVDRLIIRNLLFFDDIIKKL